MTATETVLLVSNRTSSSMEIWMEPAGDVVHIEPKETAELHLHVDPADATGVGAPEFRVEPRGLTVGAAVLRVFVLREGRAKELVWSWE